MSSSFIHAFKRKLHASKVKWKALFISVPAQRPTFKRPETRVSVPAEIQQDWMDVKGIWGVITVLWNGVSGEAVCNWQVGPLSSVLTKLSYFLKGKRSAWRRSGRRGSGSRLRENLSSFQTRSPLAAADLASSGLPHTRGGTPSLQRRIRVRVWLTTLWPSNPPATLWKLAVIRKQSQETLCAFR